MRVLALTHVFPRAADDPAAPFLLTWAQALTNAGIEVAVLAPHEAGLPVRHVVGGVPVRLIRYAPDRLERVAYRGEMHQLVRSPTGAVALAGLLGGAATVLRQQVKRGRPDVVHLHWWVPAALIARLARVDVPTVATLHGTDVALLESRPRLATLARWALAPVDRVEVVSSDLGERLERATGRAPDAVTPMPLPADRLVALGDPPPSPVLRVVGIGRLVPDKGFADLVSAVALLDLDRPVRLTIVGEGPMRQDLSARAAAVGVDLDLPGRIPPAALHQVYADADVVVQPSRREGYGLVAAEALVMGRPVVATDSGGARDVLPPGDLVAVGDPSALAARLQFVASDLPAARAAAAAGGDQLQRTLSGAAAAERAWTAYRAIT